MAQAAGWNTLGGNAQHTGVSATAAQSLKGVRWSTPVDLSPNNLAHFGSPVITPGNTVIIPVKTGANDGFRLDARTAGDGSLLWSATTDYISPPHGWLPSYSPVIAPGGRIWYAGKGGTVFYRDNLDAGVALDSGQVAFYGIDTYRQNPASFDSTVFIDTPITADGAGNIYFGFRTLPGAPSGLASGIARIDTAGNGTWIAASAAAGDTNATFVPHQAAPALNNDESTLYVVVAGDFPATAYLVGLNPATLAVKESTPGVPMRVALLDPRNEGANPAMVSDNSSASPMVGPDGDVYFGVLGNPFNGSRGWLLHYSSDLAQTKTPGGFGWDNTPAVIPAAAVPSYAGTSPYLLFSKYNDYAGGDGGTGVNRIAVLDPNGTMVEPHASSGGQLVMNIILSVVGPTPDPDEIALGFPDAVSEWCINAAAVDPFSKAVMANSEDGNVYRWDLATNTLSQTVTLSSGSFEAYTPTVIGPDGTVYAINSAVLNAIGPVINVAVARAGSGSGGVSSTPAGITCGATCNTQFSGGQPITLDAVADAGSTFTGWLGDCTGLGSCQLSGAASASVSATFASGTLAPLNFDLDRDTRYDALTDGMLAIRYLSGLNGPALTAGTQGSGATRTDAGQLLAYLDDIRPTFDIDGDGRVDASTDGLLLIRYLFGIRGASLTADALAPGATRKTPQDIEAYIQSLLPQ